MNFLSCLIILILGVGLDEAPSPSLQKTLSFQLPLIAPEENAYVGIAGLSYIADGDLVAAGLKFLEKGHHQNAEQDRVFEPPYKNPCLIKDGRDCLNQIEADAAAIKAAVQKNESIMERYRAVRQMPGFVNTSVDFADPVPRYQFLLDASRLNGLKALLDIKQNNLEAGLEAIEADMAFSKRICQSEQVSMIDLMIALATLDLNMVGLSKVIEDGRIDLSGQENRLRKMLDLDLSAGRMMALALSKEKTEFMRYLNLLPDSSIPADSSLKDRLEERLHWFLFRKNMTLNQMVAKMDKNIERFQEAPVLNFPEYYAQNLEKMDKMELPDSERLDFKNLYEKYGLFFFKNYTGEMFFNFAQPMYSRYMARINDTIVYSRLIRAQLELRLMDAQPENIPQALADLSPETRNPYTGQPFAWDAEKKILWAEGVNKAPTLRGPEHSGKRMQVRLPAGGD